MTFREVVEAKDLDALEGLLAEDVVLHSPVTFKPFEGRAVVVHVLRTVAGSSRTSTTWPRWSATT